MPRPNELSNAAAAHAPIKRPSSAWPRFGAVNANGDLQAIVVFCAIGLLATMDTMLRFPNFAAIVAGFAALP